MQSAGWCPKCVSRMMTDHTRDPSWFSHVVDDGSRLGVVDSLSCGILSDLDKTSRSITHRLCSPVQQIFLQNPLISNIFTSSILYSLANRQSQTPVRRSARLAGVTAQTIVLRQNPPPLQLTPPQTGCRPWIRPLTLKFLRTLRTLIPRLMTSIPLFHRPPPTMAQDMPDMFRAVQFALGTNIVKLNDTNFTKWKRDMEIRLRGAGLWQFVSKNPPELLPPNYEQRAAAALQDIYAACESDQQYLIMDCTTAKECWDYLKSKYENHSPANINRLWNEFDSLKMAKDEKMVTYITRMKTILRELKGVGENVPDSRWTSRLIAGLPQKYAILTITHKVRGYKKEIARVCLVQYKCWKQT